MTQCVIDPPGRDSAAGWLRSLTIANHYHPAKGSFARFPSGASLNATMQFTLLPSELGQNLSFSGADCDIHHSTVSMVSFFDRSGASLKATMQFTLLPVGCDRLRSPPYPPCERIFCPISVGSVAQCNNAIHAPTLGTRAKSFFLGCGLLLYK